jgi:hypothetical protein
LIADTLWTSTLDLERNRKAPMVEAGMLQIGIVSDTHGRLSREELLSAFEGTHLILHAGL